MAYTKEFNLSRWQNKHISKTTPLGATRLNIMNDAISRNEDRTIELGEAAESAAGEIELTQEALAMLQSDYMRFKPEAGKVANMKIQSRKLYYKNNVVKPSDMVTYLANGYKIVAEKDNILYTLSQYSIDDKRYAFSALVNSENRKPQTNVITLWNGAGGTDVFNYYSEYSVEVASTEELEQTNEALSDNSRNISLLWKLQRGQTAQFEKITSNAKEVTVPQGAISADVYMLGGMSRKGTNLCNLNNNNISPLTTDGITFTPHFNSNGVCDYIQIDGTATDNASLDVSIDAIKASSNNYMTLVNFGRTYSGSVQVVAYTSSWGYGVPVGVGTTANLLAADYSIIRVRALKGAVCDGLKVGVLVAVNSTSYEPYTDSLIDSPVDELISRGKNLYDDNMSVEGYLNGNSLVINGDWMSTDFIYVGNLTDVIAVCGETSRTPFSLWFLQLYDGKKNLLKTASTSESTYHIESGVKYIRFSYHSNLNKNIVVCSGTSVVDYLPYRRSEVVIPPEVIARCPDYGIGINENCFNYIDWVEKKYHKRVGKVDLGTLTYSRVNSSKGKRFQASVANSKPSSSSTTIGNILCSKYESFSNMDSWNAISKGIAHSQDGDVIFINDDDYTDVASFKQAMSGVMLYYELAEEEVIDLSGVITDSFADQLKTLEVEAGGTIAFNYPNSDIYDVAVPSTIEYCEKISEVEL